MRRYIPDGMKCINCYEKSRDGVIKHSTRCPDYVRPRPNATSVRLSDVLRATR